MGLKYDRACMCDASRAAFYTALKAKRTMYIIGSANGYMITLEPMKLQSYRAVEPSGAMDDHVYDPEHSTYNTIRVSDAVVN